MSHPIVRPCVIDYTPYGEIPEALERENAELKAREGADEVWAEIVQMIAEVIEAHDPKGEKAENIAPMSYDDWLKSVFARRDARMVENLSDAEARAKAMETRHATREAPDA